MRDKILDAIDKGILKVLTTDIEDENIEYDSLDINNDIDLQQAMDNEVQSILDKRQKSLLGMIDVRTECQLIMSYYDRGYKYHVKSLDELRTLLYARSFQGLDDDAADRISSMVWLNTTGIATYILSGSNTEVDMSEYNENHKGESVKFVKLYSQELNDGYILIDRWQCHQTKKVQYSKQELSPFNCIEDRNKAMKDFDGYRNTYRDNLTFNKKTSPVMKQLISSEEVINRDQSIRYDAYIPAAGELLFIDEWYQIIYHMLTPLYKRTKTLPLQNMKTECWSSTKMDDRYIWEFNGSIQAALYSNKLYLFVLFKPARLR